MTYVALHAPRENSLDFGIVALIVLGLLSVAIGVSNPEAITAEYQIPAMVGP
jgi:hypothetical protein